MNRENAMMRWVVWSRLLLASLYGEEVGELSWTAH